MTPEKMKEYTNLACDLAAANNSEIIKGSSSDIALSTPGSQRAWLSYSISDEDFKIDLSILNPAQKEILVKYLQKDMKNIERNPKPIVLMDKTNEA